MGIFKGGIIKLLVFSFAIYAVLFAVVGKITEGVFYDVIEYVLVIIQGLAIIIGAVWAYTKFGWEKKIEQATDIKRSLMIFSQQHNLSAARYHQDKDIVGYKNRLINSYIELITKVRLALWIPRKTRKQIYDVLWFTVGNDHGPNNEKLKENWARYEDGVSKIYKLLDAI